MTRSSTGAFPSPAGTYATSSEYFIDLIDDGVLPEDYAIFSLPGMESASTSSDIDGDTDPWTVVDGASNAAPSGMPFVISANVDEDALTDGSDASVATPTEVTLTDPADGGLQLEDAIIFVNIGGASGSLTGREVNWENLNPTTRENDLLAPAAGAP